MVMLPSETLVLLVPTTCPEPAGQVGRLRNLLGPLYPQCSVCKQTNFDKDGPVRQALLRYDADSQLFEQNGYICVDAGSYCP